MGGWGIRKNGFMISLKESSTAKVVYPKSWCWPVQDFFQTKTKNFIRAKRIFTFDVELAGSYEVVIENPESLKLNPSSLFLGQLFRSDVDNRNIEIVFDNFA